MLEVRQTGDLFTSGAKLLVNPVNCVGVPGAGLAKAFAQRFPESIGRYVSACKEGLVQPGTVFLTFSEDQWIAHFPTKVHWRNPSQQEWISSGMRSLRRHVEQLGVDLTAMPAVGCGLGGLPWSAVRREIEAAWSGCDQNLVVYAPR